MAAGDRSAFTPAIAGACGRRSGAAGNGWKLAAIARDRIRPRQPFCDSFYSRRAAGGQAMSGSHHDAIWYMVPRRESFWRWTKGAQSVEWKDGRTIAFREEIAEILAYL